MRNFKTLTIWQDSMELVKQLYRIADLLPSEEKYGLRSQLTRSAVSIPSNIAEGCSRDSQKDFYRFLEIALGSAFELETQLLITSEIKLSDYNFDDILESLIKLQKQINSLMQKVTNS